MGDVTSSKMVSSRYVSSFELELAEEDVLEGFTVVASDDVYGAVTSSYLGAYSWTDFEIDHMSYQNSEGVSIPCFRINSKNTAPSVAAYINNVFAYKFENDNDYSVYTYNSGAMNFYRGVVKEDIPSNGWKVLGYAFESTNS